MSNKQKSGLFLTLLKKPLKIKSSHNRFAGTCGSNHKISPAIVRQPLPLNRLQNTFLEWMRFKIKKDCRANFSRISRPINRFPEKGWVI